MKPDCLFCQIAHGDKAKLVWEDQSAVAFRDIHPKASVHILVVPKEHVDTLDDLVDPNAAGELLLAAKTVAKQQGIAGGYRLMINVGRRGGQLVDHLHIHVLGGKAFSD